MSELEAGLLFFELMVIGLEQNGALVPLELKLGRMGDDNGLSGSFSDIL
jgi:hypothetical protein